MQLYEERLRLEEIFMAEQALIPVTSTEAMNAFNQLRREAADVPEMSLDEINQEIVEARAERRTRTAENK